MSTPSYDVPERDVPQEEQPDSHGRFSLSEDWLATIAGLGILGLVLLGATVNINVIVSAALPSILQALILITTVFLFAWWFAGLFGLDKQLRALLASALSICGVSAVAATTGPSRRARSSWPMWPAW